MESFKNPNLIGKEQEAIARIHFLKQQTFQGGNVDSEKNGFEELIQKVTFHLMTPEEAVIAAEGIVQSRQDYH